MKSSELGRWGEEQAANYMRLNGYTVIERNFHCRYGEIDVIAENERYVVFLEVKLRRSSEFASAREYVTVAKQSRILNSAGMWLSENATEKQPRFDVLEIYAAFGVNTKCPIINHIEDAFQ